MTYLEQLHKAHLERRKRLGAGVTAKAVTPAPKPKSNPMKPRVDRVRSIVEKYFNYNQGILLTNLNIDRYIRAKFLVVYILKEWYKVPCNQMYIHLNYGDKNACLYAYNRVKKKLNRPQVKIDLENLKQLLGI